MRVSALYRHPIKSHGRESLEGVRLEAGQSMPFDRRWAVAHDSAKADGTTWAPCANFSRGAKAPQLMAINAVLDEATHEVTLTHPDRDPLTVHPIRDADRLIAWVQPLVPQDRALPARVLELVGRGYTDTPFASLSLCNQVSHRAVETLNKGPLSLLRWRGNLWFEGTAPWQEFEWIDRDLRLGGSTLRVKERITRCLATTANPETGEWDVDTLGMLNTLGHQDFGVYVEVTQSGNIALGDTLELL
ncbi:MOSC N-terminal beta barrel domain-containing protein [Sulfitobacter sp. F26204]|uniref:MOSC domain-containing protein n=1 Tax=Sulfitobacter sp. F26204 TaxID=2996014 RepID=UPI00225DE095|nr:MOSC N-terminal beta barrel domain-containing protein [Sulfitobacter sp. F26204]MCX7558725.1 MOSC N-terminal beta barrel domain-containing protein [Sulfitobacter sp. F26204]